MNKIFDNIFECKFEIVRYLIIVFIIIPAASLFVMFNIDNIAEKKRSVSLISEISEIQWRSEMVREEFLTTRNLMALAAATDTDEYASQIITHSKYLQVNIDSLIGQTLLTRLINASDFSYLKQIMYLVRSQVVPFVEVGHPDYKLLLKRIDSFKKETWRITNLASNATYVQARSNENTKNQHISSLLLAIWLTLLFSLG